MGLFVVFEGVEGSGKSTQSRALARRLDRAGIPHKLVREPGGTPTGERVRRWLKEGRDIPPLSELLLFSAARAALVEKVIRPSLQACQVVLCDRYIYSTIAYQGYGRGLDMDTVRHLNAIATGGLLPDLVVLLDLSPEVGLARREGTHLDRFELEHSEFHSRVRQGYLEMARAEPERWLVLDSSESVGQLSSAIWERVTGLLEQSSHDS